MPKGYTKDKDGNIIPTGWLNIGRKHTEETKKKMRESAKKRGISKETREKMINSFIGYKRTDEQKKKISDSIKIKWMIKKGLIYV